MMAKTALTKELGKIIDGYRDQMIDLQKRLSAIPALSTAAMARGKRPRSS
jgi:hypothetical protein